MTYTLKAITGAGEIWFVQYPDGTLHRHSIYRSEIKDTLCENVEATLYGAAKHDFDMREHTFDTLADVEKFRLGYAQASLDRLRTLYGADYFNYTGGRNEQHQAPHRD